MIVWCPLDGACAGLRRTLCYSYILIRANLIRTKVLDHLPPLRGNTTP
ncbi:hypothetical protein FAIPA1_10319 [Frankia sp. AiPs1]